VIFQRVSFWLHPSQIEFTNLTIGGMFTLAHLGLSIFFALFGIGLYLLIQKSQPNYRKKLFMILAILIVILEVFRMAWNLFSATGWFAKDVLPLYTCGIFVFLLPMYVFSKRARPFTQGFLMLAAFPSGFLFMLFPSTGIGMFPLWHYNTLQSALMHTIMATVGLWIFINERVISYKKLWIDASIVMTVFAGISWLYNSLDPLTNFFFLAYPLLNTPLMFLYQWFGQPGYGIMIFLLHLLLLVIMVVIHKQLPTRKNLQHA
jgi:hypothetical protein